MNKFFILVAGLSLSQILLCSDRQRIQIPTTEKKTYHMLSPIISYEYSKQRPEHFKGMSYFQKKAELFMLEDHIDAELTAGRSAPGFLGYHSIGINIDANAIDLLYQKLHAQK